MKVLKPLLLTVSVAGMLMGALLCAEEPPRLAPVPPQSPQAKAINSRTPMAVPRADNLPRLAVVPAPAATESVIDLGKVEPIREFYPNGKIKIEREVGQDAKRNYVNQGSYKMYDLEGQIIKAGEFLHGKQQGKWTQQFTKDEGQLLSIDQDGDYPGPFTSEATFLGGQLHGVWTIRDANGQNILEWQFDNGVPNGLWTWWHPNGQKRLEATYARGVLNGDVQERDRDGKLVSETTYVDGKRLVKTVGWYALGKKHFEGYYLRTETMPQPTYDWWNSRVISTAPAPAAPDQKHGAWTSWYPNGRKQTEAQYDHDAPVGKFTWWYENGQKNAEGEFEAGRKIGDWITWHPNGLKESLTQYKGGKVVGGPTQWDAEGKLVEAHGGNAPARPRPQAAHTTGQKPAAPATRSR